MSDAIAADKMEHTRCSIKILQNVVFLERQGLALRGDGDGKSGKILPVNAVKSFG